MNKNDQFGAKRDFQYGDRVLITKTGSELDGEEVTILGCSTRNIVDFYIVEFYDVHINSSNGYKYKAATFPECCLDPIAQ